MLKYQPHREWTQNIYVNSPIVVKHYFSQLWWDIGKTQLKKLFIYFSNLLFLSKLWEQAFHIENKKSFSIYWNIPHVVNNGNDDNFIYFLFVFWGSHYIIPCKHFLWCFIPILKKQCLKIKKHKAYWENLLIFVN